MRLSVVLDCRDPQALVGFWSEALGYSYVTSFPGFEVLKPADGEPEGPVVILQGVPEDKVGKNRMHLDAHVPLDRGVPAVAGVLEGMGGRRIGAPVTELWEAAGIWWQVMADPEGNEFCLIADPGHPAPPAAWA
jgi:catechol 2,3-dioxygenase-like lactoylglutathione lyase family enzyme